MSVIVGRVYGNEHFLMLEGIMRKSCNVEELEILENQIMESENYINFIRQFDDAYVLCGNKSMIQGVSKKYSITFIALSFHTVSMKRSSYISTLEN